MPQRERANAFTTLTGPDTTRKDSRSSACARARSRASDSRRRTETVSSSTPWRASASCSLLDTPSVCAAPRPGTSPRVAASSPRRRRATPASPAKTAPRPGSDDRDWSPYDRVGVVNAVP
eukprot:22267-Pelagococcus_subviridis.AAC.2